jgi:hypothetical protein
MWRTSAPPSSQPGRGLPEQVTPTLLPDAGLDHVPPHDLCQGTQREGLSPQAARNRVPGSGSTTCSGLT